MLLVYSGLQQQEFRAEHSCSAGARRAGTRVSLCGSTRDLRHHLHRYTSVLTSIYFLLTFILDSIYPSFGCEQVILHLSCSPTCRLFFFNELQQISAAGCEGFRCFARYIPLAKSIIHSSSPLRPPVSLWCLQDEVLCLTCRLPFVGCHRHRAASRPITGRSPR